jgi:hypothetical protein
MNRQNKMKKASFWIVFVISALIGLLSIILGFTDLSKYTIPLFLLSVFALLTDQYVKIMSSLTHTENYSNNMSNDVRDHLVVIKLDGSISQVFNEYVIERLDVIKSIKNTSFNIEADRHDADILFDDSLELKGAPDKVKKFIEKSLIWEDIGNRSKKTIKRFESWEKDCNHKNKNGGFYDYKLLDNSLTPYPNFLIITYNNGRKEVLFNWDVRLDGIEPEVLVSSEKLIVEFYNKQFTLLQKSAVTNGDSLD